MALILTDENSGSIRDAVGAWVEIELLPLVPATAKLVSIDGLDGVGKSTIAEALADRSGATLLQLDTYLEQDQNRYLEALDLVAFRERAVQSDKVIVEGCLVQAALARAGLASDFSIYVVRTTQMHAQPDAEWTDEPDLLFSDKEAEEQIAEEVEFVRRWAGFFSESDFPSASCEISGLRQELIRYHASMCPHLRADLILKLVRLT